MFLSFFVVVTSVVRCMTVVRRDRYRGQGASMFFSSLFACRALTRFSKFSKRLFAVHVLHAAVLVICLVILVAGISKWEHWVPVNVQKGRVRYLFLYLI